MPSRPIYIYIYIYMNSSEKNIFMFIGIGVLMSHANYRKRPLKSDQLISLHDIFIYVTFDVITSGLTHRGINTCWPERNGRHFADDWSTCIFLKGNLCMSSLTFVPKDPVDNKPALTLAKALRRIGDTSSPQTLARVANVICWLYSTLNRFYLILF